MCPGTYSILTSHPFSINLLPIFLTRCSASSQIPLYPSLTSITLPYYPLLLLLSSFLHNIRLQSSLDILLLPPFLLLQLSSLFPNSWTSYFLVLLPHTILLPLLFIAFSTCITYSCYPVFFSFPSSFLPFFFPLLFSFSYLYLLLQ